MGLPNLGFSYYLDYALAYEKEHGQEQPLFFLDCRYECRGKSGNVEVDRRK